MTNEMICADTKILGQTDFHTNIISISNDIGIEYVTLNYR